MNIVSIVIPTVKTEREIARLISEIKSTVVHELDLIIVSGMRTTSVNRNIGLDKARGEFVIMCDDDTEGYPHGWDRDLIDVLKQTGASMVGPRLLNPDGTLQLTNCKNFDLSKDFVKVRTIIAACCAFRNTKLRYDENYIGWGWEDTDFCRQIWENCGGSFFIVNTVKVTHRNEEKDPLGSKETRAENQVYFGNKWGRKR